MKTSINLRCPKCRTALRYEEKTNGYVCGNGCEYPVVDDIPRFVPAETYASSFGLQWRTFRRTQLDSFTGTSISRDRLVRLVGGSLQIFRNREVLEAGCGAGRFTELMLRAGARVFAADISSAVEANYLNCRNFENYFVCQGDMVNLPVEPGQFDIVFCAGVIQHTPRPEETMAKLCSYVRPGGLLIMDHYTYTYPVTLSRKILRAFLTKRSPRFSMAFCTATVRVLWPLHRLSFALRWLPKMHRIRYGFLGLSPVVDYQGDHPQLGPELLFHWALLDTHDTVTDRFKHLRTAKEIQDHLGNCGMVDLDVVYGGNGVEARARKPVDHERADEQTSSLIDHLDGYVKFDWDSFELKRPFRKVQGYAWLAELPEYQDSADCAEYPLRSPLFLDEDRANVGPGHSSHFDIIGRGQGRYSHWGEGVIFSSSDNTDPNANGRNYSIRVRRASRSTDSAMKAQS